MKCFHVVVLLGVALTAAPPAWAQYGLYGAPDMLQLSPANSAAAPQYASPGASVSPSYSPGPAYFNTPAAQSISTPVGYRVPSPASPNARQFAYTPKSQASPRDVAPAKAPRFDLIQAEGPSVVSGMLEESGAYPGTAGCGHYGCGTECDLDCGDPCCPPVSLWYARASWLIMGRDKPNTLWTTYETGNNANQLSTDMGIRWGNGGEVSFGRSFDCDRWGIEATYWGLDPLVGSVSVTNPSTVSTPLDFSDVVYADPLIPGLPVDLFDGADEHRLSRSDEFHNVEVNLIRNTGYNFGDGWFQNLDIDWLVGVRYFRFQERWAFNSLRGGGSWANAANIGRLEDNITNNLIGFQFGFNVDYPIRQNLRLFAQPKFGIYNNQINHTFQAFRGDGENFAPAPGSGVPGSYPVRSTVNALSFLTEIDLGVEWQVTQRWSAFVGYRVVAATGIGLSDNQIPPYVVDIPELAAIDRNGQLVLHGAFAGASFNF